MKAILLCFSLILIAWAADVDVDAAKMEEARSCIACHSLRIVHSQRLSKEGWTREVDKMVGWGAPVRERQLLIDYLSAEYGEAQPGAVVEQSGDGKKSGR